MFQLLIVSLILSLQSNASDTYDEAVKVATKAAFKQSGYETDYLRVKDVATSNTNKWLKSKGLAGVAATVAFVAPVIIYKKIEVHSGDFSFRGNADKKEVTWQFSF